VSTVLGREALQQDNPRPYRKAGRPAAVRKSLLRQLELWRRGCPCSPSPRRGYMELPLGRLLSVTLVSITLGEVCLLQSILLLE
jgi:hypothetical protein